MPGATGYLGLLALAIMACAAPSPSGGQSSTSGSAAPAQPKSLNIGITSTVPAMSLAVATGTPTGGWMAMTEIHTDGLVTSEANSRNPVGRLAETFPTLENGGITILPDGRMKVVFNLSQN